MFNLIFFLSFFFWTYGSSQARGQIRATAVGLHHSQSNSGSKLCLQPTPQLMATPDPYPLSKGRDQTATSWFLVNSLTTEPRRNSRRSFWLLLFRLHQRRPPGSRGKS